MAEKKPVWLKVVLQVVVSFFLKTNSEGIKKIKPIAIIILNVLLILLIAIFQPESLESVLQFLMNLL